ncbi:unnamed protein product, partial [Coccothraustes coccothraustes]
RAGGARGAAVPPAAGRLLPARAPGPAGAPRRCPPTTHCAPLKINFPGHEENASFKP